MNTKTIGNRNLSAWQVAPGVTWVQTRIPSIAEKLRRRQDSRLVVRGIHGGYLRTFEFIHPLTWAERLFGRYMKNETVTNEAFPKLA